MTWVAPSRGERSPKWWLNLRVSLRTTVLSRMKAGTSRSSLTGSTGYAATSNPGGVLESPKRRLFLITDLGRQIVDVPDSQANEQLLEIDLSVWLSNVIQRSTWWIERG